MLVALIVSASVIGASRPPAAAIWATYQCTPQPCWHTIQPGITSFEDAAASIGADGALNITLQNKGQLGDSTLCWGWLAAKQRSGCLDRFSSGKTRLVWNAPENPFGGGTLRLGDAITIFGRPIGATVCYLDDRTGRINYTMLRFKDDIEVVVTLANMAHAHDRLLTVSNPVMTIWYNVPSTVDEHNGWRTFFQASQGIC